MKKFALIILVLALAACGGDDNAEKPKLEKPEKTAKFKTDDLICPQVAILRETEETFDYGGEKPDPAQLVARARMKHITGDCAYRKDGIDIAFTLDIAAMRGPRLGAQVSFPYFVAVVDPADNILSRQTLTVQFRFSPADKTLLDSEDLHVFIPVPEAAQQAGPDYRVLAGFQAPPRP